MGPAAVVMKTPIIRREMGSKLIRMEFSDQPGQTVQTVDTPVDLRNRYSLTDAEVLELARYITIRVHDAFGVMLEPEPTMIGFD